MPVPQQFARGDVMGRGPYEKSGLVADTALHPLKKTKEHFEIFFPVEEGDESSTMDVKVQLWYLPYGTMDTDPFLWKEFTETVKVEM
jgi:hypothetical protein